MNCNLCMERLCQPKIYVSRKEPFILILELFYLGEPAARRGILLGFILITLTCSSGAFVLLHYTESIFAEAGSTLSPKVSSIIVASIQLSGSYVATFMVERAGRKLLIIASSCSAATCLAIMGVYALMQSLGCASAQKFNWIPLACLSGVVFLAANGSASLPYVVLCEILGQRVSIYLHVMIMNFWISSLRLAHA